MNIFRYFFGDNIENENKSKPFYQNISKEERIDWFSRTKPWHRVSPKIISAIADKYGDNPMFEVFMFASMGLNLIGPYEKIPTQIFDNDQLVCAAISRLLCQASIRCAEELSILPKDINNLAKANELFQLAVDGFESALILNDNEFYANVGLATIFASFGKKDLALKAAFQGLDYINKISPETANALKIHQPTMWAGIQDGVTRLKLLVEKLS